MNHFLAIMLVVLSQASTYIFMSSRFMKCCFSRSPICAVPRPSIALYSSYTNCFRASLACRSFSTP